MTTDQLVTEVKAYALDNYTKGWDPVIECLTNEEIGRLIEATSATTIMGAKRALSKWLKGSLLLSHPTPAADAGAAVNTKRDAAGELDYPSLREVESHSSLLRLTVQGWDGTLGDAEEALCTLQGVPFQDKYCR